MAVIVPIPGVDWRVLPVDGTGTAVGTVSNPIFTSVGGGGGVMRGAFVNRSGTITLGGTAQSLMGANAARSFLLVQNLDAVEDLWINFTTTAVIGQPSLVISPRGALLLNGGFQTTEAVSIIAATTAHAFTAKEA